MSLIENVTSGLISKALDVALLNHQVIANNIANATTQGYRPKRLSFAELMQPVAEAVRDGASADDINASLSSVDASETAIEDSGEESVNIDHEMVALAENVLNYETILGARNLQASIMSTAINGGR